MQIAAIEQTEGGPLAGSGRARTNLIVSPCAGQLRRSCQLGRAIGALTGMKEDSKRRAELVLRERERKRWSDFWQIALLGWLL